MIWEEKGQEEMNHQLFKAIDQNVNYQDEMILGIPASYLDEKVFIRTKFDLSEAPFLSTLLKNPNHIGCHTLGSSESFFAGTQQLERDVIAVCAETILKAEKGKYDGYVASGGTEANIQAIWVYRNFFQIEQKAKLNEIAILSSSDSHYSIAKASNLLGISHYSIPVDFETREISKEAVFEAVVKAKKNGVNFFIVVANMMTTMFGSIDDIDVYTHVLNEEKCMFKIHVDGAYGGFYYPFSKGESNTLNFLNPAISSVTLDAHKMAQAPYGTGIFIVRKDLIRYCTIKEASYVEGEECTLIGSRSGANTVAIWMILFTYGQKGWFQKIDDLQKRTDWLCNELEGLKISFYRNSYSNIVTIKSTSIPIEIVQKFRLVPDNHYDPLWYKIVVMEHVSREKLAVFIAELKGRNAIRPYLIPPT